MSVTLQKVPGFNDIQDTPLTAEQIALGIHVAAISDNAAFGLVRTEPFQVICKNGDTISLPVSEIDGYQYSRSELVYMWGIYATANPDTGWITGPDALWYMNWNVDQDTGEVTCIEWYRPWANAPAQSSDGQLLVTVVGIRQKDTLTMASSPSFSDLPDATFAQDKAWKQATARGLAHNSKWGVLSTEVIPMGEFWTGKTVPQAVSPIDGHTYPRANTRLVFSWRWTTDQASFTQPVWNEGQFAGMFGSINQSTGAVSLSVKYIRGGGEGTVFTHTNHGRVYVFALCDRNEEASVTLGAEAIHFSEVTQDHFFPGEVEQASVLSQVNKNIRESICVPEFFGPTTYYHGGTIPVPTSAVDGHVYTRQELFYFWDWDSAAVGLSGHIRMAEFNAAIDPSNGKVSIDVWRLPPGGGYSHQHGDGSTYGSISVTIMAVRTASNNTDTTHNCLPIPTLSTTSGGSTGGSTSANPTGTAIKIFGDQYFTDPRTGLVTVKFTGSNTGFNAGVCNLLRAKIMVTGHGDNTVLNEFPLSFNGAGNVDIAPSGTETSDPVSMTLDADHDYYVICQHFGAEGQLAYNDTLVTALHGKIESTDRVLNIGFSGPPTVDQWYDATDVSTYLSFPASSDVWSVISAFCYDLNPVTPPVDSGSLTSDGGDPDTINGV